MQPLPRQFFLQDTITVSRALLGKHLVREINGQRLVCRITETEAYIAASDKACHAYNYKRTPRTESMFALGGTAYIYLIYGMYTCLNLVTEPEGEPCAVLIRSAEPVEGGDLIARNRFGCNMADMTAYQKKNFLNGPGKLCKGLSITRQENGLDLTAGRALYITEGDLVDRIQVGKRIGIDYAEEARDFLWRFWI